MKLRKAKVKKIGRELPGCDTQLVPKDPAGRAKEARTGARDVAGRGC